MHTPMYTHTQHTHTHAHLPNALIAACVLVSLTMSCSLEPNNKGLVAIVSSSSLLCPQNGKYMYEWYVRMCVKYGMYTCVQSTCMHQQDLIDLFN